MPKLTLGGLLAQTYDNLEVTMIRHENNQIARNLGASMARGEFLFFCDDDIVLDPKCFELMVLALSECPTAAYVYCDYGRQGIDDNKPHIARPFNADELREDNYISTMSLIRKKDFTCFDPQIKRLQDWDLWLEMLDRGLHGVYLPFKGFVAYYDADSISLREDWAESRRIVLNKHTQITQYTLVAGHPSRDGGDIEIIEDNNGTRIIMAEDIDADQIVQDDGAQVMDIEEKEGSPIIEDLRKNCYPTYWRAACLKAETLEVEDYYGS